jgi:peptidoglycan hydrolase-like protein with peptidoglycan-binding domain
MEKKMRYLTVTLITLFLAACSAAPAGNAESTLIALSVQLTLDAQNTAAATASLPADTPTPTLAPATATNTPLPSDTPEPTDEPTEEPSPTPYEVPDWPLVRNGDTGPEVRAIQHLLRSHNYNVNVDGIFGPQTRQTVIAFQNDKNIGADGIVGPNTWARLIQGKMIDQGSTGQAVRALQVLLREKFGYNAVTVDGDFGPITKDAVEDFQDEYNLAVDGIVGPDTWQALVAIEP